MENKTSDLGQGEGARSGAVVCLVTNRRDHFACPADSEMEKWENVTVRFQYYCVFVDIKRIHLHILILNIYGTCLVKSISRLWRLHISETGPFDRDCPGPN